MISSACFSWEERLKAPTPPHGEGTSVQADWIGWLPEAKMHAFRVYAKEFEARYLMLSISLNEAIGLHNSGSDRKSYQIVLITPALCERLADPLEGMLCSLEEHVRRNKMVPSVCPLNAADFHGLRGQRSARKSSLVSNALFSQRAQYLSKIGTLREMVNYMSDDFCHAAEGLVSPRGATNRDGLWAAMDAGHFDLSSCLRESMILLKCFLRVMPNEQLHAFQKTVSAHTVVAKPASPCRGIYDPRPQHAYRPDGATGCQRHEAREAADTCGKNGLCGG
jgi:hypothetical protein